MTLAFLEEQLEGYTDSELADHIVSSPRCESTSRVFHLSSNLIAKHYKPLELEDALKATEVASQLGIRGPCVRRTIKDQHNTYMIMDRIEGTTLDVTWKDLGWFMTVKLALQLRRFVKTLRSVTSPTAGSLATGECRSFWLEDRYVPVTIEPFVLTHHDLAPRNLLVSPSGQLSLLDWDLAGFYPVNFEYASMYNFNIPEDWGLMARLRWHLFVWIGVGYYETGARLLQIMRGSVRLDMAPGYGSDGQRGKVEISSKPYVSMHNAIKTLTFHLKAPATVETIIDTINSKGRDKYKFTAEWEECRFWIGKATWDAVSFYWRSPNGYEPREVKQGTFY
ncbi:kinase-like protein [Aspergillus steynii IBT 23096]|uniref:Kinase-like protein n=1 Tax=Aspergillus steynii IBT 23096 TaxID=1392250 RepID=A0A2I2GMK1_9EURO|nr:kinase-like protein [Aspergillus steynii IBT 23096]PLB54106.1 kinase-like protein [Aspergillus steynii IBT 23096]